MKLPYILLCFLLCCQQLVGAQVDTVEVFSNSMQKNIKTVVVQPTNTTESSLPTLYLLHGYSGKYSDYIQRVAQLQELVDRYQILVVCPDGGYGSWYWDVDGDQNFQYETFVSNELVDYISANFPASSEARYRAITGFSMGGHGALYLALRHQNVYGAVASIAGGVDIRPFPNNWDMAKRLGSYAQNASTWESHTVMEMLHLVGSNPLPIYIDCGRDDFFHEVNLRLHNRMTYLNIPHHYQSMPGKHDWAYVSKSLDFQFAFFHQFFGGSKKQDSHN